MNVGICKTDKGNEGDKAHDESSQGFFEDAFSTCLHESNTAAELRAIDLDFSIFPSPTLDDVSHKLIVTLEAHLTQPESAEDETSAPLGWIQSLPPGHSPGSLTQHQRHDSSNSSRSGLLGSDIMMVDESQVTAWSADEGFLSKSLGNFAQKESVAGRNQPEGDGDVIYPQANATYFTPFMNRIASPATIPNLPVSPQLQPSLSIGRILEKSRVETQIPVVLTLHYLPEGIKRIHFPPSSISKSKLLSRPPPPKSLDMLELHIALVCTSAMFDPTKRKLALNREAGEQHHMKGTCNREENQRPFDGGEVNSCPKCIKRERKRANRKKVKNLEEEEVWQRDEAQRIVVFNTQEVIDLQDPVMAHNAIENMEVTSKTQRPCHHAVPTRPKSIDINLAMRITCYCRHHEEKIGFQVIFTLKDHKDRLIAQEMTSSIMITDDHKAHSHSFIAPSQSPAYLETAQLPSVGVFPQQPLDQYPPLPIRQIHSATDLHKLQQGLVPSSSPHNLLPALRSQSTAAMTASLSFSRPVSPNALSGRTQKRRKANGFGNETRSFVSASEQTNSGTIRQDPTLVRGDHPPALTSDIIYPSPGILPPVVIPSPGESLSDIFYEPNTSPPTPLYSKHGFVASPQSSHSMQNMMVGQQVIAFQDSTYPSNVPSREQSRAPNFMASNSPPPVNGSQSDFSTSAPSDDPSSADSTLEMLSGATFSKRNPNGRAWADLLAPPEILRIVPGEGPKSGGIEVTFIGVGFYAGLSILFGGVLATISLHHSSTCIVCILPPTAQAGTVEVRCNHDYGGTPPERKAFFRYFDNDEDQLIKLALTILHHKATGITEDAGAIARRMVDLSQKERMQQHNLSHKIGGQHYHANAMDLGLTDALEAEATLLRLLDMIDLDDSINQPRFNKRNSNGHTMLHLSASLGFQRLAAALLARGANPDLRDRNGMSSMHMASMNNHVKVLLKLRSVGGDPTLRSLRGYTPFDFALTEDVRNVIVAVLEGSSPTSSFAFIQSHRRPHSGPRSTGFSERSNQNLGTFTGDASETLPQGHAVNVDLGLRSTFSPNWIHSSRNSASAKPPFSPNPSSGYHVGNERFIAAMAAWSVWRDQLSNQVQQLQQTVHRTFPNLPTPTFPPIPNLPGYQDITVVRLLLGLVPQLNLPSIARDSKDHDYHWWELLKGSTAPPPYEELYPCDKTWDGGVADASAMHANVNTHPDLRCSGGYIQESFDITGIGNKRMTSQERRSIISAHEMKVKRLRNDRKLFFFWIPLLILVLIMMLKDGIPQFWSMVYYGLTIGRQYFYQTYGVTTVNDPRRSVTNDFSQGLCSNDPVFSVPSER